MQSLSRHRLTELASLDPRSLAIWRIGAGLVLLADLIARAGDLTAMYSDQGILPVHTAMEMAGIGAWSLHWISGEIWYQAMLFTLAGGLAIGMVLGYKTRFMVLGSWALLASLHARNTLVLNGGDLMLRMLLFWSIFLPLGRVWSLDAARKAKRQCDSPCTPIASIASLCFVVQVALVYWFAGISKLNSDWWGFNPYDLSLDAYRATDFELGGAAVQRAMSYDAYAKPLAGILLHYPRALKAATIGTIVLEVLLPLTLFFPFFSRWWRVLTIAAFALLHVGIELTLHVGWFTWAGLLAWAALLPSMVWDSKRLHWLSRMSAGSVNRPPNLASATGRLISAVICLALLNAVMAWNAAFTFKSSIRNQIQRPLRPIVNLTALAQRWNMFSKPHDREAWLVYRGSLQNGQTVDVFQDRYPLSMAKPPDLSATFTNHRWRKLHANLVGKRHARHRKTVAGYICRVWDSNHRPDERIAKLEVFKLVEPPNAGEACARELCVTIEPTTDNRSSEARLAATPD